MGKKLIVHNGIFTITDTISNKLEFQSLAIETYLDQVGSGYYFYYDTFINGDNIKKSRSIDYPYSLYQNSAGITFASVEQLSAWVADNLGPSVEQPTGAISGYKADYDSESLYIYSAYYRADVPFIVRTKYSVVTVAQSVTNLTTDWDNRVNLMYI